MRIRNLASLLASLAAGLAAAQTPAVIEDELVVTGVLEPESQDRLPAGVDVIDAAEIEERQLHSVSDVLRSVAGVDVVRSGSAGKVTSVFSRGTESDHTLALWNGIELNNPYFGGFDWAFLSTEGLDRVEVVRGPFSALYGADAVGGVVNVVTRERQGGSAKVEVGEDGYQRGNLTASRQFKSGHLDSAGHVRRGDGLEANDFFDSAGILTRAEHQLGERTSLGILARVNDVSVGIPRSQGVPSPNRRTDWRDWQLAVPFEVEAGSWAASALVSWVELESRFTDPDDAFGFTSSRTESSTGRIRSQASYRPNNESWVAFGVEGEQVEVDDRSSFGMNLDGAGIDSKSAFAQSLWTSPSMTLDLGVRVDDFESFGSRLSPRVALAVRGGNGGRLWASYGEGFRAPSVGELFFPFSGNASLEPEESESFELGGALARSKWTASVVGFENDLRNLIDFDFQTFTNLNIGRARSRGIELSGSFETASVTLKGNATHLDARDLGRDVSLLRRPKKRGSIVASFRGARATLTATGLYVGARPDVNVVSFERIENPSYTRFDFAFHWRSFERWTPFTRVENALDEQYDEAAGFRGLPRSFFVGLRLGWQP